MGKSGPSRLKLLFSGKWKKDEDTVEEEILSMVTEGHEQGIIQEDEAEMINNIFEFNETEAKDIMTNRQKIQGIDIEETLESTIHIMLEQGHSRYPLYQEDLDNIVGILHLKDVMKAYISKEEKSLQELARKPYFVHPTQRIQVLLNEMQRKKLHMAIVVDEYGQTEGIVAMEDILEEIVGEIMDEYDEEEQDIIPLAHQNGYMVKGLTRLEKLSEVLQIEFDVDDIDTLNGFLLLQMGRLPNEKEQYKMTYQGYLFETVDVKDNIITLVRITVSKEQNNERGND